MKRIVVPLDGSELAEQALPLAARLAQLQGAQVLLLRGAPNPASLDLGTAVELTRECAHEYLEQQAAAFEHRYGRRPLRRVLMEHAPDLVLFEARQPGVTAVVMSTHGRSGLKRLVTGSVAEHVVRMAPVPVYLVPAQAAAALTHPQLRHILVPLDGSQVAHAVLAPVAELARETRAEVILLRIFGDGDGMDYAGESLIDMFARRPERLGGVASEYFHPIREHLAAAGVPVTCAWNTGNAADGILAAAPRMGADLIALGTHGRSGLDRLRHGSVAEQVLRHAAVPVMTFGHDALKRLAAGVSPLVDKRPGLIEAGG
ncbi:MAG TPA: universal stress protein [Chloroflexota bacterium]|nr:universal stress protein [Chloroflexota bacterium]